jgi:chemotaxis methyl-accepting protein methylase
VRVAERLVAERTGIELGDGLRERLAAYLDGAARARGQTPARFAAGLAGDPGAFQEVLDRVTVQETGFFRHPDQFAALAREVLPALDGPVVVWSAGCANGQEAYSLAMELAASGLPDWRVVATDISAAAVARARAGRYFSTELAGLPATHRHWLRPSGNLWEVDPALRHRVRVERANLTDRFPVGPGRCQVVFCRNVLIYLSRSVTESFLDRLADWLAPGGLVFLGYSEAVLAPTRRLRVQRLGPAHALRVVPDEGSGSPGSGLEGPGGCGQPATPSSPAGYAPPPGGPAPAGRVRGRPGSPARDPPRRRWPRPGRLRRTKGTTPGPSPRSANRCFSTPTTLWPGSGWASPSGRSRTGAVPGGRTRPPWPRSSGATGQRSRPGWTGGRRMSWRACSEPGWGGRDHGGVVPLRGPGLGRRPRTGPAGPGGEGPAAPPRPKAGRGRPAAPRRPHRHRGVAPRRRPAGPGAGPGRRRHQHRAVLVDEVVGIERVQEEAGAPPAGQRSPLVAGVLPGARPLLLLDVGALTGWLAA